MVRPRCWRTCAKPWCYSEEARQQGSGTSTSVLGGEKAAEKRRNRAAAGEEDKVLICFFANGNCRARRETLIFSNAVVLGSHVPSAFCMVVSPLLLLGGGFVHIHGSLVGHQRRGYDMACDRKWIYRYTLQSSGMSKP